METCPPIGCRPFIFKETEEPIIILALIWEEGMNPGPAELVQLDHWAKLEQVPRLPDYLQLYGLPRLTVRAHRTDVPDRSVFFPIMLQSS